MNTIQFVVIPGADYFGSCHPYSLLFFSGGGGGWGGGGAGVIYLDFVSVNENAKNRAMSIKQAWSVHIQLNHDKTKGQGTDYGCSNEVWYIEVLFLIFYCVPFNSKTATPPPSPPGGVGGAYTGHLTGVLLRTVVDPK